MVVVGPHAAARRSGGCRRGGGRHRRPGDPHLGRREPCADRSACMGHAVALEELRPDYLNNAVAALRLSSLPTAVWWRRGNPEMLEGRGQSRRPDDVSMRRSPRPSGRARCLAEHTAISDFRWARLTRWRALMAQFFDISCRAGRRRIVQPASPSKVETGSARSSMPDGCRRACSGTAMWRSSCARFRASPRFSGSSSATAISA